MKKIQAIQTEKAYDNAHAKQLALEERKPASELLDPGSQWPTNGSISFSNVTARYRKELDLVLKDVSFHVKSGQKVGICGRTGSGKSSMMLTLFRVLELEQGSIHISGVDVRHALPFLVAINLPLTNLHARSRASG
jgi:ABC-type multidrug transport system fused ATPase/permease subunit